jgi:DNA helicase-2/ATP-dependent DNA helicase PcrA
VKIVSVDLNDFTNNKRLNVFYEFLKGDLLAETTIAIQAGDQKSKYKAHKLAQALQGKFSSIEEVEGKELFAFVKKLDSEQSSHKKLLLVVEFAKKCFTGLSKTLTAGTARGDVSRQTKKTKYPLLLEASNIYLEYPTSNNLLQLFILFRDNPETHSYRRDLLNRCLNILKLHCSEKFQTVLEAANSYQKEFRYAGRPIRHTKQIGTTLLVKGLEYDHAIVLDADSLNKKELYVAMTRGSKSLTIITKKDHLYCG